jgi:hypothetical protein
MEKFEIRKIDNNTFHLNIFQGEGASMTSNGSTFKKDELYQLYIKLREIFSVDDNKNE